MDAFSWAFLKILSLLQDHNSEERLYEFGIAIFDDHWNYKSTQQIIKELQKHKCP